VPNNIANFLNGVSYDTNGNPLAAGLPTSNILGRVTGGNISNIFGTIQTTGFGSANLFLMNPAGIMFGPNAQLQVDGAFHATTADYIALADGTKFNALNFVPSLAFSANSHPPGTGSRPASMASNSTRSASWSNASAALVSRNGGGGRFSEDLV